tara:strand:- start:462 stop:635 length:174 start_codon:yes stop_codon:yes gene_type:complete
MMNINEMLNTARTFAAKSDEEIDSYWGEYTSVLRLTAAYYGGLNTASDMTNYKRLRS